MLEQDGMSMTSKDVRLYWSIGDKKKLLDGAVIVETLRLNPGLESGYVRLKINSLGLDFMKNIDQGMVELRWDAHGDNPYVADPICKFLINRIEDLQITRINDHSAEIPVIFEVMANIEVIWHVFKRETVEEQSGV